MTPQAMLEERVLPGPRLRTDIIDVYVVRRMQQEVELLQVHRAEPPLAATWQPLMGHIEAGETAVDAARREMLEEVGLSREDASYLGMWALEQVHPYFLPESDSVVLSPRFVVEVSPTWVPRLNEEHDAMRWVAGHQAERFFMWPGQIAAVKEIRSLMRPGSPSATALRLHP